MANFDIIKNENLNQKLTKRDLALKCLQFDKDPHSIINSCHLNKALDYLIYLFHNENINDIFDTISSLNQASIINILIDLVKLELSKTNFDQTYRMTTASEFDLIKIEIRKDQGLASAIELLSKHSTQFCTKLHENSRIKDLFEIIDCIDLNETNENQIRDISSTLLNLSCYSLDYQSEWNDCEKYLRKLNTKESLSWFAFLISENLKIKSTDEMLRSSLSYEHISNEVKEIRLKKINLGYKYLLFLNEPETIIRSEQSMNIIYYISGFNIQDVYYDEIDSNLKLDFIDLIIKLMKYLYDETIVNVKMNCDKPNKKSEQIIRRDLVFIEKLAIIIQDYSNVSLSFCSDFSTNKDGIQCLFNFIQSEYLSDYLVENLTKKVSSFILKRCFDSIIGALQNLSHLVHKFKKNWSECDSVQTCIKFTDKLGVICQVYRTYVYMILANIANDYEIDTLSEIRVALSAISDYIHECAKELNDNPNPYRIKIQIEEYSEKEDIIFTRFKSGINFHLVELLTALYHLAVNDNVKQDIFEKCSMRLSLKIIILKGNEVEKEFALKLLYQLCFDEFIAKKISKSKDTIELIDYLRNLLNDRKLRRKNIIKYCKGIFWMINNEKQVSVKNEPTAEKHLMISYNRESRDLCLSIKAELEKLGYKIWIDVEDIHGSSLESMANAIEKSACVLMCMTEKYKLSSNCRLEAEYAMAINKPIIPLILQKDYKPDGWLGIILGSKMFINFLKYDFEECIRRLRNEILNIYKNDQQTANSNSVSSAIVDTNKSSLKEKLSWSESQVDKWLNNKNFKTSIIQSIKPCNGKLLYQMYSMLQNAPEFFYSTLKSNGDLQLKDLALFSYELSNLFEN